MILNIFPYSSFNNSSQPDEKKSSINLNFKASIKINGTVLIRLLVACLLGGSIFVGGVSSGICNIFPTLDSESGIKEDRKIN